MGYEGKLRLVRLITRHIRKLTESISYYEDMLNKVKGIDNSKTIECPYCVGRGILLHVAYRVSEEICEVCEGSGKI